MEMLISVRPFINVDVHRYVDVRGGVVPYNQSLHVQSACREDAIQLSSIQLVHK